MIAFLDRFWVNKNTHCWGSEATMARRKREGGLTPEEKRIVKALLAEGWGGVRAMKFA